MQTIHASCVAIGLHGVLLLGEPGAGKSDMALRLIDRGARLVADDQVQLSIKRGVLSATSLPLGRGLLEVRGLGIMVYPIRKSVSVALAVQLVSVHPERLPSPQHVEHLGMTVPLLALYPLEASAPIKIEIALKALQTSTLYVGAFKD